MNKRGREISGTSGNIGNCAAVWRNRTHAPYGLSAIASPALRKLYLPGCTEKDIAAWRRLRALTAWEYAMINGLFPQDKVSPAEYGAGMKLAIERGWLILHESGTFVRFTPAGADLFA